MKSKSLGVLAAVTVLAVAAAAWSVWQREQSTRIAAVPASLYPGLAGRVNEVASVKVAGKGLDFTMQKGPNGDWTIPERGGYPVEFKTVKRIVVGIADMKPLEAKTAQPALLGKLGLKAPKEGDKADAKAEGDSDADRHGTRIALAGDDGKSIAAVIIGKTKSMPSSTREGWYYVRKADSNQSWLVASRLEVGDKISAWLSGDMPVIKRERMHMVRTEKPNGEVIRIARPDSKARDFKLQDMPEGWKMKYETAANALGSAVGFLAFDDVRPADKVDLSGATVADYTTFDGLVLTVRIVKRDDGYWAGFKARFDPQAVAVDSLPEDQRKDMKSPGEVKKEVGQINKRYGDWAYLLPDYKGTDFMIARNEIIVPADQAKQPGG
ncbi:MAG TPA: DUF4340 domain-containing protein [Alphaproteobacteria bacterium]|nr:DUF4340 domain-containing protein [Alphaproteobacteria bacterium]